MSHFSIDRHGRVTKDKYIIIPSTPTIDASAKVTAPVSATSTGVTTEQVENLFAERDVRLVDLFTEKFLILTGRQLVIDDISPVSTVETTEVPVPQPSATLLASQPPYGMPMHYFSG